MQPLSALSQHRRASPLSGMWLRRTRPAQCSHSLSSNHRLIQSTVSRTYHPTIHPLHYRRTHVASTLQHSLHPSLLSCFVNPFPALISFALYFSSSRPVLLGSFPSNFFLPCSPVRHAAAWCARTAAVRCSDGSCFTSHARSLSCISLRCRPSSPASRQQLLSLL